MRKKIFIEQIKIHNFNSLRDFKINLNLYNEINFQYLENLYDLISCFEFLNLSTRKSKLIVNNHINDMFSVPGDYYSIEFTFNKDEKLNANAKYLVCSNETFKQNGFDIFATLNYEMGLQEGGKAYNAIITSKGIGVTQVGSIYDKNSGPAIWKYIKSKIRSILILKFEEVPAIYDFKIDNIPDILIISMPKLKINNYDWLQFTNNLLNEGVQIFLLTYDESKIATF